MKKGLIAITIVFLLVGIAGAGYYFYNEYQNKNDSTKESNSSSTSQQKEEPKKDDNIKYITMDPSEVEIPILMYHSISDADPNNSLLVPVSQFDEQVAWLKAEGYTPMLMEDVFNALETGKVPEKPVAITFDDGYSDNYTDAYRILKKYDMKGTFFIITNNTDNDGMFMDSKMLKEMVNSGMGIENHTSIHQELNTLPRETKVSAIKDAKDFLKSKIGVDSKYLCYPVGRYDEETIEVAKELGIKAAVTTNGGYGNVDDGIYELDRVRVNPMDLESFKLLFE